MTVDDETAKQITTGAASTAAAGLLGFLALWFTRIISLPRRTDRLEARGQASDRLLLALADSSLARAPKGTRLKLARRYARRAIPCTTP